MAKLRVLRVPSDGNANLYKVVVVDAKGRELLGAIEALPKDVANSIAKDLANVGGDATVVTNLVSEESDKIVWIQTDNTLQLNIVDETAFTLIEQADDGETNIETVREILREHVEVEWIPETETPGHDNRTPTKGIAGS